MPYPYDPSWTALLTPAEGAVFFAGGRPSTEASLCAELARIVYAPFEKSSSVRLHVQGTLLGIGFSECHFFNVKGTQGFLTQDPSRHLSVLVFRGTERDVRDWISDIKTWPEAWPTGGKVHTGFSDALKPVRKELEPRLEALSGRVFYTGHSLGAALATLTATLRPPTALYTFGSPRVGDQAFIDSLPPMELHRYNNCCDAVCRLPPEKFGYVHVGGRKYLDQSGTVHDTIPAADERADRRRARLDYLRKWAWRFGTVWTRGLADHAPVNYVSALGQSP